MVWHAGYEQSREAQEIAQQIQKLCWKLSSTTTTTRNNDDAPNNDKSSMQEQIGKLKQEYKKITGEAYDE